MAGIKSSIGLRNYMLGTAADHGSFRDVFSGTSAEIRIYGGTVPDVESAAGSTPLVVIQKDGTDAISFAEAGSGVIQKASGETWKGTIAGSAPVTPKFYRLVLAADDDGAATLTTKRVQGTVGNTGTEDLVLSSATITGGEEQRIDYYQITFPATEAG